MQFDRLKRRAFIALLGGAAAWPFAARAQRSKPATIGLLGSGTAAAQSEWTAAFVQRLRELGWSEGRNIAGPRDAASDLPRSPPSSSGSGSM
jgi:putative tryptophan/tyrosine transport system substrate-binding protein